MSRMKCWLNGPVVVTLTDLRAVVTWPLGRRRFYVTHDRAEDPGRPAGQNVPPLAGHIGLWAEVVLYLVTVGWLAHRVRGGELYVRPAPAARRTGAAERFTVRARGPGCVWRSIPSI